VLRYRVAARLSRSERTRSVYFRQLNPNLRALPGTSLGCGWRHPEASEVL
jgi:hypothetical protein